MLLKAKNVNILMSTILENTYLEITLLWKPKKSNLLPPNIQLLLMFH